MECRCELFREYWHSSAGCQAKLSLCYFSIWFDLIWSEEPCESLRLTLLCVLCLAWLIMEIDWGKGTVLARNRDCIDCLRLSHATGSPCSSFGPRSQVHSAIESLEQLLLSICSSWAPASSLLILVFVIRHSERRRPSFPSVQPRWAVGKMMS